MRNSKENRKKEINSKNKTNKRNQIIRKDIKKGTTVIEFNLSKAVIMLIIIGVVLAGLLTKEIVTTIIEVNKTELLANEDVNNGKSGTENTENGETQNAGKYENENSATSVDGENTNGEELQTTRSINGDLGYISSIDTKEVKTGTGPFDENDEPGNDSSENNDIVRSFDQITWTYQLNFALKEPDSGTSLKGGVIQITASLPKELANIVEWDIESMKWLSNANLSEDGINLSGEYSMSEEIVTIPGNQEVIFILKVKNAVNGTKIQPSFTFMLEGNEEEDKKEVTAPKEITVSATGRYNIQLHDNTGYLSNKTTVDYGEGEVTGRMYGYGFTVQLYNNEYSEEENPYSKGLKGIEYPKGEISFDINLKLERSEFGSDNLEDITEKATPILWNYRVNNWDGSDKSGNIENREMYSNGHGYSVYDADLPLGKYYGKDNSGYEESDYSVYNSGNIKIEQDGSILHVKINNYELNGIFPMYGSTWKGDQSRSKIYTENIGTFSVGYMQIFVPDTEASTIENRNYYLTVSDNNMKVQTNSQLEISEQMNIKDDNIKVQHVLYKKGGYGQNISLKDKNGQPYIVESNYGKGDGKINKGDILTIDNRFYIELSNDYDIYTANRFIKFDGEGFEPVYYDDGSKYKTLGMKGKAEFKVWYVTKSDGTNWINQEEMNNGNIEDMEIYETIEEIPKEKKCIGIYVETISGYIARSSGGNNILQILLKIKETAEIGKTYGITQRTWYWKEELDRSIYTIENKDIKYLEDWPETEWDSENRNYIKTEYDENGQMVAGTHSGSSGWGNTVLVVGANLYGSIRTVDENNKEQSKTNYDLGKNEEIVTYSLEPKLDANENLASQIEDVTLKVQVILPKGLSYELGSSRRGGEEYTEPEITENADGTTTLVWYINGVTSGKEIEPIEFGAKISKSSDHGMQYTTTFIISEHVGENGITKIGNSEVSNRTSTVAINIINLASFRLYKEAITPITEKDGEIQYRITGINTTDVVLPDFVLLDIMPYNKKENAESGAQGEQDNGDGRGTEYRGTYTIEKIVITQNIEGKARDNSNLKVYYTQDEQVKTTNAKDENIGEAGIWTEVQETNTVTNNLGVDNVATDATESSINAINTKSYNLNVEQANDGVTGIAIKGELAGQTEIIVDTYIKTNGNQVEDKYVNSATAQTQTITEVVQTSQEKVQVIGRTISGKVWLDENYNNIIDNNEDLGNINKEEIWIKLYKENENKELEEVTNVDGEKVEAINPDETGYYEFTHLPSEKYILKIEYNGEKYKLVEKEIGSNTEINSKFEIETSSDTGESSNIETVGNSDTETEESTQNEQKSNWVKEIGKTDLLEKLNDNSNYMIKEENVNAGLKEKINLEFTKVAEEDHTDKIGGTEFKLYKLVCTEHEEGYHDTELINTQNIEKTESSSNSNNTDNTNSTENLDSCWQLVDTQSSKIAITNENQGTVKFEDLEINQEYRLVETKASINRIKPEGQWKIEFSLIDEGKIQENANLVKEKIQENTKNIETNNIETQENNTESETSGTEQNAEITKINNGVKIKIESIGEKEAPAFAIRKNEETGIIEELLLPNRAYFQFPTSGSIGSNTIYKIGIITLILGIFLLIIRNKNLIKSS